MQFPPEAFFNTQIKKIYKKKVFFITIKMQSNETEKQYNELKKKFRLPEFNDINHEFELSDLEQTSFLLRETIRRIAEKLDFYTAVLEGVLQPDASSLHTMHETRFFD